MAQDDNRASASSCSSYGWIAAEAEGLGVFTHGGYAEGDVILDGDAEFHGAVADVVAGDTFSEGFVL